MNNNEPKSVLLYISDEKNNEPFDWYGFPIKKEKKKFKYTECIFILMQFWEQQTTFPVFQI